MKMGTLEKRFVNSASHSEQVCQHAEAMLKRVPFSAGQSYLDVGCGNGLAPLYLAQKYDLNVTGIDVDPAQIELARTAAKETPSARFEVLNGVQLPFDTASFDLVATNKVTHHIPNWPSALAEMVRVLKPGGYLLYADLVFPQVLATIGQYVIKERVGFPTRSRLNAFVKQHNLATIHLKTSSFSYEMVCRKHI